MQIIMGIGIDIVEIDRIKSAMDKNPRFVGRVFTKDEVEQLRQKEFAYQSVAGGFAAKEAVSKAIGTGIRGISFGDLEILKDDLGKPYVRIKGKLANACEAAGIDQIMVSISHSKLYAVANAVAVRNQQP